MRRVNFILLHLITLKEWGDDYIHNKINILVCTRRAPLMHVLRLIECRCACNEVGQQHRRRALTSVHPPQGAAHCAVRDYKPRPRNDGAMAEGDPQPVCGEGEEERVHNLSSTWQQPDGE